MLKKIVRVLLYLSLFYVLAGFILLPFLLKPQLIKGVASQTNMHIDVESVSFNPLSFELKLHGVTLYSLEKSPLLKFQSFLVNLEPFSFVYGAIHIKNIVLEKPKLFVVMDKQKNLNLLKIVPKETSQTQEENTTNSIPYIIIDTVALVDGEVLYEDYSQKEPFHLSLNNIGFKLKNIDTKELNSSNAGLRLYANLSDGGFVDLKSRVEKYEPLHLSGDLAFEASKLYTQWRYVKEHMSLEVADGKLSFETKYDFNSADINNTKIYDLHAALDKLRIKPKEGVKDILNLKSFYVNNAQIKPFMQDVTVEKIGFDTLSVKAKRNKNGLIDWVDYLQGKTEKEKSGNGVEDTSQEQKWHLLVKEFTFENGSVFFNDAGISPAVNTQVDKLAFGLQNITLDGAKPLSYQLHFLLNKKAKCDAVGTLVHKELDFYNYTNCQELNIAHYQPYITDIANKALQKYDLNIKSVDASISLENRIKQHNDNLQIIVSDSNLTLNRLAIEKKSTKEQVISFSSLDVTGVDFNSSDNSLLVSQVFLEKPDINIKRYKNEHLNF